MPDKMGESFMYKSSGTDFLILGRLILKSILFLFDIFLSDDPITKRGGTGPPSTRRKGESLGIQVENLVFPVVFYMIQSTYL